MLVVALRVVVARKVDVPRRNRLPRPARLGRAQAVSPLSPDLMQPGDGGPLAGPAVRFQLGVDVRAE
jgi:hypothetical protein